MTRRPVKDYNAISVRAARAHVGAVTNSVGLPTDTVIATGAGVLAGGVVALLLFPGSVSILIGAAAGGLLGYKIGSDIESGKSSFT